MATKKVTEKSVNITPSLQKLFLVGVAALFAVQLLSTIYFLLKAPHGAPLPFWLYQASVVVVPAVFFGLAVWYVGKMGSLLNRIFKAAMIALIGVLVLSAALQVGTMYPILFNQSYYSSAWSYYPYILMGTVTAAYIIVLVGLKTKRIKRG